MYIKDYILIYNTLYCIVLFSNQNEVCPFNEKVFAFFFRKVYAYV